MTVPSLVLHLLGEKGRCVLEAALASEARAHLRLVVVGRDTGVTNDCADEITALCDEHGIRCAERTRMKGLPLDPSGCIAVAAGWRWLITEPFEQLIVFHDSLLPRYRGFNPLVTALLARDPEIGVTAIIANAEFDRGDIVDSRRIGVTYPIRIAEAITRIGALYFDLASALLARICEEGPLTGTPQDEEQASYSVWRDEDDYRIDWSRSAEEIRHFVDCLSRPYKGASTTCDGARVRVLRAEPVEDVHIANRAPGKVLFSDDAGPVVICGEGLLRILEARSEDGRDALPLPRFRVRFG